MWSACRALAARSRPALLNREALAVGAPRRNLSDEAGKTPPGAGKDAAPGEFEAMFRAANNKGPLEAHGLTPSQEEALYEGGVIPPASTGNEAVDQLAQAASGLEIVGREGHKFPLPELPIPWYMQMKNRYHPVLAQLSRLLMREGKLSKAQSVRIAPSVSTIRSIHPLRGRAFPPPPLDYR